jgi:hypothetical protein
VGAEVVGDTDGGHVGAEVVGDHVGKYVGAEVGAEITVMLPNIQKWCGLQKYGYTPAWVNLTVKVPDDCSGDSKSAPYGGEPHTPLTTLWFATGT